MADKVIEFKVNISDFDGAAWKRLEAARKEVAKIQTEILEAYQKSDRAKAAYDLAGFGIYGTKYNPVHRIEHGRILTNITVDLGDDERSNPVKHLNLGEKTINALLNGRLLTDRQKKALLKQVGVDLDELSEKAGA
ncbi:hypothetical protein RMR10_004480 [Agrobacterium rosae]|uniref:hypothetical protein n=1 Tax=Agrobacterium rosae TaxID=1972867 RepID=UPI002A0D28B6|nr:hypothetical protein [Agrobacterium rosae]MDX8315622.1 hypothetical protein [Agrobacterium rosae]